MSLPSIKRRSDSDRKPVSKVTSDSSQHSDLDRPSPLASELEARTRDLEWTLTNFAFVAQVTALAAECDVAHSPAMSVASCRSVERLGLTFVGDSSALLATYAAFLADPGSEVSLLVNEAQRSIVEQAFEVRSVMPKWQLLFRGDAGTLDPHSASELGENDLAAVQALARAEKLGMNLSPDGFSKDTPAFGVWERRKLVSAGMTLACLPGVAQIDNVITRAEFRRRGYGSAVVSALLLAHLAKGRRVLAVVNQDAAGTLGFFEKLGFAQERAMYSMECVLKQSIGSE